MNKGLKKLDDAILEIDYFFQEGVVFSKEDKMRMISCSERLNEIINDPFLIVK